MDTSDNLKFGLKAEVLDSLIHVFESFQQIDSVLIYGSRAMGNWRPGSDIDLAIVLKAGTEATTTLLAEIREHLERLNLIYTIDLSFFDGIQNPALLNHIKRVGQVLY